MVATSLQCIFFWPGCEFKYYDNVMNNYSIINSTLIKENNEKLAIISWIEHFLTFGIVSILFRLMFEVHLEAKKENMMKNQ